MMKMMSLTTRRELLSSVRQTCRDASWTEKGNILDGVIAAVGYDRKHASKLVIPRLCFVTYASPHHTQVYPSL